MKFILKNDPKLKEKIWRSNDKRIICDKVDNDVDNCEKLAYNHPLPVCMTVEK